MKNKYKKILTIFGLTLVTNMPAYAEQGGLFVEPMVTYEKGKATVELPSPFGRSRSTVEGFGIGTRLGFHVLELVFIGADGRYSWPVYKNTDTSVDRRASSFNYGPVVGVQMPTPFGIRAWAGYILGGELDVKKDGDVDFKFKSGNGYRVGTGAKLTIVSLNLEYQNIKYDNTQLNNAGIFSGSTNSVVQTNKSLVFSVSMPIAL